MSAPRKFVLSAAALFLGLSGLFLATATSAADTHGYMMQCDEEEWNVHCT